MSRYQQKQIEDLERRLAEAAALQDRILVHQVANFRVEALRLATTASPGSEARHVVQVAEEFAMFIESGIVVQS